MFKELIRKKDFRRFRVQLKGARILRNENKPFFVEQIVSGLTNTHLNLQEKDFPISLVGTNTACTEILLRQILLKIIVKFVRQ